MSSRSDDDSVLISAGSGRSHGLRPLALALLMMIPSIGWTPSIGHSWSKGEESQGIHRSALNWQWRTNSKHVRELGVERWRLKFGSIDLTGSLATVNLSASGSRSGGEGSSPPRVADVDHELLASTR